VQPNHQIKDIGRPPRELSDALAKIGTATASSELSLMGIRDPHIRGPLPLKQGKSVAGPALTLRCMPKREDLYGADEYENPELQLHRHVLYPAQAGDMVVVDARGDMASGIFGEMMLTFFAGRGGAGVVVDGCIRDAAKAKELDLGIGVKGVAPNYHAQTNLIPFAVNVPIACANVLVMRSTSSSLMMTALWLSLLVLRRSLSRWRANMPNGRSLLATAFPRAAISGSTVPSQRKCGRNLWLGGTRRTSMLPAAQASCTLRKAGAAALDGIIFIDALAQGIRTFFKR
jgi:regulator of RNase E activity RraA